MAWPPSENCIETSKTTTDELSSAREIRCLPDYPIFSGGLLRPAQIRHLRPASENGCLDGVSYRSSKQMKWSVSCSTSGEHAADVVDSPTSRL